MIFHEAPHKLEATLKDLCHAFGEERKISLCRELTKLNEEVLRMTLAEAVAYHTEHPPRGEYVLIVEGASEEAVASAAFWADMTIQEHVAHYTEQGLERMAAIKAAAKDRGVPKNEIYKEMI